MIAAKISQIINVNLSDLEARDIAIQYIYSRFNWKPSYYIKLNKDLKEEWVFYEEIAYSSHSFKIEHKLRKASNTDKIVYQFLREIVNI